jgi:NADH dehydrogenase
MMRLLVTGANGFVGSAICREAIRRGHPVVGLVREGSNRELLPLLAEMVVGNFSDEGMMLAILRDLRPDCILHAGAVVSGRRPNLEESWRVNVEGTEALLRAAHQAGVTRWIQISSMSSHPAMRSIYGGTKHACDQRVKASPHKWTILRPSLVYGPQERGIFSRLRSLIRKLPLIPIPGDGSEPMRPIHVDDLAMAALNAAERPVAIGRVYCLGGPEQWTMRDVMVAIANASGRAPRLVPVPLPICRLIAMVGECLLEAPPLNSDNLEGIIAAEAVDIAAAQQDLDFAPRPFSPA